MSAVTPLSGWVRSVRQGSAVAVRPMRERDVPQVMDVERAAYEFPWTEGVFRDCLRVGYTCWLLAEDRALCGHAIASVAAGESHLLNLCVVPDRQRAGLGRFLLEHMIDVVERHGAREMFLEVRPSNPLAIGLYERTGFRRVGFRKNYYPDNGGREDALVMSRTLVDATGA